MKLDEFLLNKMDPVELGHHGECTTEGTSDDQLLSQGSPDINEIFGDPQVLPRVGDQYQVEIPPLMTESEHLHLLRNPAEATDGQSFLMGLPIPIMWFHEQVGNIKHEPQEFLCEPHARLENGEQTVAMHMDLPSHQVVSSRDHMYLHKSHSPLPYSIGCSWNNMEVESFLLGLYIFGKNLVLVKDFVETKEMGDILSYYYGKFYRSDSYRRWSECRKIRSKKCIYGQRIFTGWRQHELFSRLLSHASKECLNSLLEVSKSFSEGRISLEDYVSTLKTKVGKSALIQVIGIGKGKQDLTGIVDPIKTARPEIPTGNECNSLSSGDIIKFLTGDFRLSKNRSNDLFWEAVWPRLLARGWHSEQPKNHCYVGSNHSLVFLIPGVKKFSKRRLVKGKHYFDSVADVLNQVTLDPTLLEIEGDIPIVGSKKEENGWDTELKIDEDLKFTVVDTSLVHGEGPSKVSELRTLPVGTTIISPMTSVSRETDTDSSEEPEYEIESTNKLSNGHGGFNISKLISEREVCIDQSDCLPSDLNQGRSTIGLDSTNVPIEDQENSYVNICRDNHRRKSVKSQFSPRVKPCRSNYLAPITKRRRLTVCRIAETSHHENALFRGSQLKEQVPCCHFDSPGAIENMAGLEQEKFSTASSAKGSSADYSEVIPSENCVTALSHEKVERRPLIDLNLPHLLQDSETDELVTTEVADSQDDPTTNNSFFPVETNKLEDSQTSETFTDVVNVEEQPVGRRQSTRNRPLTAKALEALACGYLSTKRKPRGEKGMLGEHSISRPSRRPRGRDGIKRKHIDVVNGGVDRNIGEGVDEECSANTNIISNSQNWFERNVIHDFLGVASPACHPEFSASKDD